MLQKDIDNDSLVKIYERVWKFKINPVLGSEEVHEYENIVARLEFRFKIINDNYDSFFSTILLIATIFLLH